MCDFGEFAVFAADILHDELVEVAGHVTHVVLTLDYRGAFRVCTQLDLEVLEDGTFGDPQSSCNIWQISYVRFDTIQSTFLLQLH